MFDFVGKKNEKPSGHDKASLIERAIACRDGLAATEFAMVLPVMTLMFFGLIEGSDVLSASRRATVAVNSLADLAAQSEEIDAADAANLFTGVERMLEPTAGGSPEFRLMSVVLDDDDDPVIDWSIDSNGAVPYEAGSDFTGLGDTTILDQTASLIVVELTYSHSTTLVNRVFPEEITFERQSTRWPRLQARVKYCQNAPC